MLRVKSVSYFIIIMLSVVEVHCQGCVTQTIGENCEPICKSICTNGYCNLSDDCICNPGYTKRNDACEPVCERGCLNGTCAAPNTCRCDSGYNLVDGACQPVCTEPCENGTCTAPETCECKRGYYKRTYSYPHTISCEPHCFIGCPLNSYCDAPGRCKCNPGWRMSENSLRCLAVCRYSCGNGTCVLPDRCLCAPGFQINNSIQEGDASGQVCEPISNYYGNGTRGASNKNESEKIHQSSNSNKLSTTTTRDPLNTKSTYDYYNNHDDNGSTTTTVSYYESSSSSTDMVVDDAFNVTAAEKSWMQQHGMYIWIPIIVVVTAGLILLLVWQRIPMIIVNFFKRRSYNVQGAFLKRNCSGAYETLHIITYERETQSL